jgi:hypothetical protein
MAQYDEGASSLLIAGHTAKLVDNLAKSQGKSATDCLRDFMATKTYAVLRKPASFLCLESTEHIEDMLEAEKRGDWTERLEARE